MSEWQTYRLEDFVPFTAEVYFRLTERINETFWPLHLVAIGIGLAALVFAWRGNPKIALVLLAPAWIFSGIVFHFHYYAEINVAAQYFGWAFLVQAALLLAIAALTKPSKADNHPTNAAAWVGATITALALLAYPLIAVILGSGPTHAETFGLHPDPTAIATLGIGLMALRGTSAGLAILIPFLWCLIATLTLLSLEAAWATLPLATGLAAVATMVLRSIQTIAKRTPRSRDHPQ